MADENNTNETISESTVTTTTTTTTTTTETIYPITHAESVLAGEAEPITHFEKVIAKYCTGGGSGTGLTQAQEDVLNKLTIDTDLNLCLDGAKLVNLTADIEKKLIYDIFNMKLDETTNPLLVYRPSTALNKGLNPTYFTGNNTKLLNVLNMLYRESQTAQNTAVTILNKHDSEVGTSHNSIGQAKIAETKSLLGYSTLIDQVNVLAKRLKVLSGGYTAFSINCTDTSAEQLKISPVTDGSITELIINDVAQTVPTTTTTYPLIVGENIIKIKGNFRIQGSTITNLTFLDTWLGLTSLNCMFKDCTNLTSLNLNGLNTSNVTDMISMFYNCSKLTSLYLDNFDTSSVTDMGSMFGFCNGLTRLDLSNFDTSDVTSMNGMFEQCMKLTTLDLSSFDTSKVSSGVNIAAMLYNIPSNATIKVGSKFTKTEAQCEFTGKFTRV